MKPKMMFKCVPCGEEFQMGPDIYAGKYIASYQMHVCSTCYAGNWDGYGDLAEPLIRAHLQRKGIEVPPMNEKGRLPRE